MHEIRRIARRALLLESEGTGVSPVIMHSPIRAAHPHLGDAVCSVGAFDGVHAGHVYLIDQMVQDARRRGLPSVVVTFDVDPDEVFLPREQVRKILNNKDRIARLAQLGADYVFVVPFTRDLAAKTYREFMQDVLPQLFFPRALHVGCDFRLGSRGSGTVERLRAWGVEYGCEVFGYDLLCGEHFPISATRIRNLLAAGNLKQARELLGRNHFIRGTVVQGRQKGRTFGIPTANVALTYPYQMPGEAVYAGLVAVDGMLYPSAMSVGIPPTFELEENCGYLEPFLLGFEGTLYDKDVAVIFVKRLREMRKFVSVDELIATVESNIEQTRELFGDKPVALG